MYEAQILDKEVFSRVKKWAVYSSERTGVVSVEDENRGVIPAGIKVYHTGDALIPLVSFEKSRFEISNIDDQTKSYLNIYGAFGTSVGLINSERMYNILSSIDYETDASFNSMLYPLNQNSRVGELISSGGVYFNRKKVKFTDDQKKLRLKQVFSNMNIETINKRSQRMKITSVTKSIVNNGIQKTDISCQYKNQDSSIADFSFSIYGKVNPSIEGLLKSGSLINVLVDDKGRYSELLPYYLKVDSVTRVSPSKEAKKLLKGIPVAVFRAAYYEYKIRTL